MKKSIPHIRDINYFKKNGFIILKDLISKKKIRDIKKEIYAISKKLYIKYNKGDDLEINFNNENFDAYLLKAKKKNLTKVTSSTYDACKKIFTFISILSSEKIKKIAIKIMETKRVGILNRGFGVRIDYPYDKYYKARLHQDYSSQLGSLNGLVLYIPLRNIDYKSGPIKIYKKSHLDGVYDTIVNMNLVKEKKTYDPYYVDISKKKLNNFNTKKLILSEGDVVFFHFCLLHESGLNISNEIRWSLIARYMDFDKSDALEIDYMGGQHEGNIFKFNNKKPIRIK